MNNENWWPSKTLIRQWLPFKGDPNDAFNTRDEGELGVVIKDTTHRVSSDEAKRHILGYTCLNDVTARDLQSRDRQWTRSKSFDTFCPIGPCIETALDPDNLSLETLLNGEVR